MAWTPLPDRLFACIDVETSGLDPNTNEILEFAGKLVRPRDFVVIKDLYFKVKPLHIETAHPKALQVNGYTPEKWADAIDPAEAAERIASFCEGAVILGHNPRFDIGFINALLRRYQIEKHIDYHVVDTVTLAIEHLVPLGLDSVSLVNVCKFLGIPNDDAHTAMGDVNRCLQVYQKLARATCWDRWRWGHSRPKSRG